MREGRCAARGYGGAVPSTDPRPEAAQPDHLGSRAVPGLTSPAPLRPVAPQVPFQGEFTFRANVGVGRHGWLRLTPAYGVKLVRDRIDDLRPGSVVTDPFSGTGTTPLAAAEARMVGQALDINPFLLWLGRAKIADYAPTQIATARETVGTLTARATADLPASPTEELPWVPPVRDIQRWWAPGTLAALSHLRVGIDEVADERVRDVLEVTLCRTVIACSGAAFNHQSMSFAASSAQERSPEVWLADSHRALQQFATEAEHVLATLSPNLSGTAVFHHGDARHALPALLEAGEIREADLLLTSPPYCNRMSYVRELRPYMYWTRHLDSGAQAGELDWQAIGGTWGAATSRLTAWEPETDTPVDAELARLGEAIRESGEETGKRNGPAMATYVHRYHHDMWLHLRSAMPTVRVGGELTYVVGNSTFFGHEVRVQEHLAAMLRALGAADVRVTTVRKRSSKKALFEYAVSARRV